MKAAAKGSGGRWRADGVVMVGYEGGGGDVADVMMAREARASKSLYAKNGLQGCRRLGKGTEIVISNGRSEVWYRHRLSS